MEMTPDWYVIENVEVIDSPALVIYPGMIRDNITKMIEITGGVERLRPHVKTYKMLEVVQLQMEAGINKFKCATISEAEMLCEAGAHDVLLAYQPVGPKIDRLAELAAKFPQVRFSALIDNISIASALSSRFENENRGIRTYIDLDTGNHRTGVAPNDAFDLYRECKKLPGIEVIGLHAYDGHIRNSDLGERTGLCNEAFQGVTELKKKIRDFDGNQPEVIAGGTPTFPIHARREGVICSPGTCLLWDWGYHSILPDLDFSFAALVITRVISRVGTNRITLDLGHKAIASENPFPRVHFLNLENGKQVSHSEEHLVIEVEDNSRFEVGEVLYGVPWHICPTVALYAEAQVVTENRAENAWKVVSRDRMITV